jgi:DtxR family Mn-dependent transcriptional regulator
MDREESLSASLEDYLEAIFLIIAEKKVARSKDITKKLGVSGSSVTGALRALGERAMINYAPYDVITLTDRGEDLARNIVLRHKTLKDFFHKVLFIDAEEAEKSACEMEHSLSRPILHRMVSFIEFIENCPLAGVEWAEGFGFRCTHGESIEKCTKCREEWQKEKKTGA